MFDQIRVEAFQSSTLRRGLLLDGLTPPMALTFPLLRVGPLGDGAGVESACCKEWAKIENQVFFIEVGGFV